MKEQFKKQIIYAAYFIGGNVISVLYAVFIIIAITIAMLVTNHIIASQNRQNHIDETSIRLQDNKSELKKIEGEE